MAKARMRRRGEEETGEGRREKGPLGIRIGFFKDEGGWTKFHTG